MVAGDDSATTGDDGARAPRDAEKPAQKPRRVRP